MGNIDSRPGFDVLLATWRLRAHLMLEDDELTSERKRQHLLAMVRRCLRDGIDPYEALRVPTAEDRQTLGMAHPGL